jgi:hypothetical protein
MTEDYTNFYKNHLEATLTELDELRKKIIKNRIALTVIAALFILVHSLLIVVEIIKYPLTIFISLFALPLIAYFVYRTFFDKMHDIEDAIQELLVKEVLWSSINPIMDKESLFIAYTDFKESQLYDLQPEHYTGRYYMKGGKIMTIGSYIDAGIEDVEGEWQQVFKGYYLMCEEKFIIQGITIIKPDDTLSRLGILGRKLKETSFNGYEYLQMSNKEFSKKFAVYSNNVIESYKLLTDVVVDKIMTIEEYGFGIGITFTPKRIYATIEFAEDTFAFNHWKTLLNPEKYSNMYLASQATVQLIREIGLAYTKKEVKVLM